MTKKNIPSVTDIVTLLKQNSLYVREQKPTGSTPLNAIQQVHTKAESIQENDVFIAYCGVNFDSHKTILEALKKFPSLVIYEDAAFEPTPQPKTLLVQVKNSRAAWSHIAALVEGDPHKDFVIVGVTGTNGKTSTCWIFQTLLTSLANATSMPVLYIGTLGIYINNQSIESHHTTPDPPQLFASFSAAKKAGVKYAVMEVSSHSIAQSKLDPISFDVGVFTSFSRDHLDFHGTMSNYWQTKQSFFDTLLRKNGHAIIHQSLLKDWPPLQNHLIPYESGSTKPNVSNISAQGISSDGYQVCTITHQQKAYPVQIPFTGTHNLENFLAAWLICQILFPDRLKQHHDFSTLPQVPGRMEKISLFPMVAEQLPKVFVDFAHTPDALEKILLVLRPLATHKLWLVFGCGGDRDQGKRPLMGVIASKYADFSIVTSDNPRSEEPMNIINSIISNMEAASKFVVIPERAQAIEYAIKTADKNDLILIAGKGHERTQIIGEKKFEFCDQDVAKQALQQRFANAHSSITHT